jgi:single-strand DNA-binding protein
MFNQVILIGRVVRDPLTKKTEEGKKLTELTLAVQRPFKNLSGQYDADFIKVGAWDFMATQVENYCEKGTLLCVRGRLITKSFEINQEKKFNYVEVIAERFTFLSGAKKKSQVEKIGGEEECQTFDEISL